jgi:hypothetical protein
MKAPDHLFLQIDINQKDVVKRLKEATYHAEKLKKALSELNLTTINISVTEKKIAWWKRLF